jgi:RimJ/RimL family protein N-acetyltransferase
VGTSISPPRALERVAGGFVVLRAFEDADVPQLLAAFNDPEIARWNAGPTEVDAVLRWMRDRNDWAPGDHASWAVAEASGTLVGSVSLHRLDRDQADAEVGYWTAPWARRRGVATAALALATSYAFGPLGLHRVYLYHAVENPGSCVVAECAGFRHEGTLRQSYLYGDGRYHDEHLHGRLADDPPLSPTEPAPVTPA